MLLFGSSVSAEVTHYHSAEECLFVLSRDMRFGQSCDWFICFWYLNYTLGPHRACLPTRATPTHRTTVIKFGGICKSSVVAQPGGPCETPSSMKNSGIPDDSRECEADYFSVMVAKPWSDRVTNFCLILILMHDPSGIFVWLPRIIDNINIPTY